MTTRALQEITKEVRCMGSVHKTYFLSQQNSKKLYLEREKKRNEEPLGIALRYQIISYKESI